MVDKTQKDDDRLLASLLRAEAIADDGFSNRIVRKIRRRLWLRRLSVPTAVAVGGIIAFRPVTALILFFYRLLLNVPQQILVSMSDWVPPLHLVISGVLLLALAMLSLSMLED